jgi:hypothetical protein
MVVAVYKWISTGVLRHRLKTTGSNDVVVQCAQGHFFTTIWIAGASFKSVRLGWRRYQHCPVGKHWNVVTPLSIAELSYAERIEAARVHDIRIP